MKNGKKCETKINAIEKELATLKEFKANAQKFIDKSIYESRSPIELTEFGKRLLKESDFYSIFEKHKNNLVNKLTRFSPATKYDVQEKSRELMNSLNDCEAFKPLKTYAFNNGKDFGQILRAGAIPLRDYYLKKHPEITQ